MTFDMKILTELISLCIKNSYFEFNGEYYLQIRGLPMGSALSPVLANIFMELLELKFPIDIFGKNSDYFRYVDDTLVVVEKNFDIEKCLEILNNLHEGIKFTHEIESEQKIPFLDVMIHRSNIGLKFQVYRKPLSEEKYVHWYSYHDSNIKRGVVFSQFLRAFRINDPEFLDKELLHIENIFKKLAYPDNFIKSILRSVKKKIYYPKDNNVKKDKNYLILPCPPSDILRNSFPDNTNIVVRQSHRLASYFLTPNNKIKHEAGIYVVPCNDCNKIYVGESDNFTRRINQHKYSLNVGDENSALHNHRINNNHNINIGASYLNTKLSDPNRRKFIESCMINTLDCFNTRKDTIEPFLLKILDNYEIIPKLKPPD
jgi:hypothetical protein